jgi:hypothetical protein
MLNVLPSPEKSYQNVAPEQDRTNSHIPRIPFIGPWDQIVKSAPCVARRIHSHR